MSEEKEIKFFCCADIKTVTYLAFKGFKFQTEDQAGKTIFIFEGGYSLLKSLADKFSQGASEDISPLQLLNKFREIKIIAIGNNYKKSYYKKDEQK
jgi:hypothetical protein